MKMIGTGGYFRGPELEGSSIHQLLNSAGNAIDDACGNWKEGDTPAVIVMFVVPGSLGDVNFTGQRVTLFSRKKKLLQIEAAVPKELVAAASIDDFVISTLHRAAETAAEHFERKKAGFFDLAKANSIIDQVHDALSARGRGHKDRASS
jgi:hypothetical protein